MRWAFVQKEKQTELSDKKTVSFVGTNISVTKLSLSRCWEEKVKNYRETKYYVRPLYCLHLMMMKQTILSCYTSKCISKVEKRLKKLSGMLTIFPKNRRAWVSGFSYSWGSFRQRKHTAKKRHFSTIPPTPNLLLRKAMDAQVRSIVLLSPLNIYAN